MAALLLIIMTALAMVVSYFNEKRVEVIAAIVVFHTLKTGDDPAMSAAAQGWHIIPKAQVEAWVPDAAPVLLNAGIRHSFYSGDVELYHVKRGTLYRFHHDGRTVSMLDPDPPRNATAYILGFAALLLFMLWQLYRFIRASVLPIRQLSRQIARYHHDRSLPDQRIDRRDEIGEAAGTFYALVTANESLRARRTLFTRNIVHELKTPLMQMKLAAADAAMPEPLRLSLERGIARQSVLLDELLDLESVLSDDLRPEPTRFYLIDLLEDVCDALAIDDLPCDVAAARIESDYRLTFLIIKNLLDNAVRHTDAQSSVTLHFSDAHLCITNRGAPPTRPLPEYIEPFSRERPGGMGLGLYIVNALCERLGFAFDYGYEAGRYRFCVRLPVICVTSSSA